MTRLVELVLVPDDGQEPSLDDVVRQALTELSAVTDVAMDLTEAVAEHIVAWVREHADEIAVGAR